MEVSTEAKAHADHSLTHGSKPGNQSEDKYRPRSQGSWIQSASSNVEKPQDSVHQTDSKGPEILLPEAHALQSNMTDNSSTKEDDTLPVLDWNVEPNRDNPPLRSKTSLVLYKPQASTLDNRSLQESILVPSEKNAEGDKARIQETRAPIDAVYDDHCNLSPGPPATPSVKRTGNAFEASPEGRRQAYVEDADDHAVPSWMTQGSARTSGGPSISNDQEGVTEITPSEHITKAQSPPESSHSSHRRNRGSSFHGSELEAIEPVDEHKREFEKIEIDELGTPILMWPLGPAEAFHWGAPKEISRELPQSLLQQNHDSEGPEAQRHGKRFSEEAPIGAFHKQGMLNDILDECHHQISNSKIRIDSTLYAAVAEQDESNVTNTAELLKNKADLTTEDESDVAFFQQKETIFVLATKLLHAFTPRGHSSVVGDKYWGAVDSILVIAVGHCSIPSSKSY